MSRALWIAAGVVWLALVLAGMLALLQYSLTPGAPAAALPGWPAGSKVPRVEGRPALVVFAHPHCPCTGATIGELAIAMSRVPKETQAFVVVAKPAGAPVGWVRSSNRDAAAEIPGVTVLWDDGVAEARRFGAVTSGQTFVFGPDGALRFNGGITGARGHQGDNAGRSAVEAILNGDAAAPASALVFGCRIEEPEEQQKLQQAR